MKKKFSTATIGKLKHYVYVLVNRRKQIFYVGKGVRNRAFDHGKGEVEILRYNLPTEQESINVEAAVIDALGLENLKNEKRGHDVEHGRQTWKQVEHRHGGQPARVEDFDEPYMLFFINETYSPTMSETEIYDCTRQFWYNVAESKREKDPLPYPTALAVVGSFVVRAYSVEEWFPAGTTLSTRTISRSERKNKWEFVGQLIEKHPLVDSRLTKGGQPLPGYQLGYKYFGPLPEADQ
jgi:uncharacterized protein